MGFVDTVKGILHPEKPLSLEHWLDSLGVATTVAGGYKLTKDFIDLNSNGKTVTVHSGTGNIARNLDPNNIPNMTKKDIINNIPDDWKYTEHNGFVHIRDTDGQVRIRIDPPDKTTNYPHVHVYDSDGKLLDSAGNIVDRKVQMGVFHTKIIKE